ncbi:hypothetical protein [Pseudanabaena sp. Chao 1811]|uniref:hypothetical protein n=1 Tax=Pseudanabaena sp. Chao 1811 TaxID=2963092 RepID=UPI0022F3BF01|nr:hypothetical protein [Pseudanabaena sp. Chao 1811]
MKAVRLNLEDRQAWQKLQYVLTSLASDYMDLVAAEQTEFKFEQQVLSIAFTLIAANSDRDRLNEFTQSIDRYFNRLQLIGVRRIEWEFYVIGEDNLVLSQGRDIPLVAAPAPLPKSALARTEDKRSLARNSQQSALSKGKSKAGNLVRRLRGWLLDPKTIAAARTTSRITIRDPKGALEAIRTSVIAKFNDTIQWVDNFPWETWTKEKAQQIKRRHQRNLVRAVIEDVLVLGVLLICLYWLTEALSGPTINLALLPPRHYDNNITTNVQYRCGNPGVTLKNYVCLGRGMGYDQVASILGGEGKPLGIDHKFGDRAVIVSWSNKDMNLNATFVNDKLVARAYRQLTASK